MSQSPLSPKALILIAGDIFAATAGFSVALIVRYGGVPDTPLRELYTFAAPFLIGLWIVGLGVFGLYDLKLAKNEPWFFERLARALLFNFAVTVFLFYLLPELRLRPLVTLLVIFIFLAVALFGWRNIFNTALARRFKERVCFLGVTDEVLELSRFLAENPQLGFIPVAYATNGAAPEGRLPLSAPTYSLGDDLAAIIRAHRIEKVVVAHEVKRARAMAKTLFGLVPLGVSVVDLHRFYESVTGKVPTSLITETWFLENLVGTRRPRYEFAKRITDLVLATLLGALAVVLFPFVALAIIFSTPGDIFRYRERRARPGDGIIFFRQPRVGKNGVRFDFVKFRSQVLGAERLGHEKGPQLDQRAYPIGAILRKTYLDELPQLVNVIRGEMSFVGPRPERPEFVVELEKTIPFYRMRELVLPGITGWAQISMEDDASVADAPEKIQYDLYYIKNRSLALDAAIMLKTILKLLQRSGR